MKTKFMSNNMKENKNFKRLVIFAVLATMCLSALALLPTASADCPEDCPSGMISYWKLDETSSGPVEDCYGPNDAANIGATINQPGQVGTSYGFNGAGDYILAPSLDSQIDDTLTIAAWLYNDESTPGATNCYFRIVGLLHLRRGSGVWDLDGEGGLSDVQFSWNFDNHQQEWHYHVVTLNVSGSPPYEVRAFVDGVEEPGSPFSIAAKSTATYTYTYIGQFSSSYSWEGSIDEVAIYNRTLSPYEIQSQYYTGLDGYGYCNTNIIPPMADANGPYEDNDCDDDYTITFDGSGSIAPGGTIVTYDWDFGDGTGWHNDIGATPSNTYPNFGEYTVTLRVTDNNGLTDTDTSTAKVYCPPDCPSGMISYWKLDETSSGPVEDCYGPNDAVNNGATINQPGQVGTAYGFNGAGDYIQAPSLDSQIDDTLTIAAWLYNDESTPGVTNAYFRIVGLLHLRRGSGVWDLDGEGGLSDVQFSWNFDNHQQEWHYHVVTLNVSGSPPYEVRAFVDGVEEPGSPFSIAAKSTATYTYTYIGQASSSYSWEGSIDEVAIYNRVLSASEILSQYYTGLDGFGYCYSKPVADANGPYEDTDCDVDYTIDFDGSGSTGYQMPLTYDWDFGDGTGWHNDIGATPSYTYSDFGEYTVTLRVTDNDGLTDTDTSTAEVYGVIADTNGPYEDTDCDVDYTIIFDGSGSTGYQMPLTYDWDFGDGTGWHNDLGEAPSYTFSDFGDYTVTLRVTESGNGCSDTDTSTVKIHGVILKADFSYSPNTPTVIDIVTFIDNSSDDNDNLVNWSWDFGDGYISYQKNTTHQYNETGNYTVTLIVTDEDNASGVITKNVTIVNIAPIANFTYSPNNPTNEDILSFIDNSEDIDGIIVSWSWDFGDGGNSSVRNPTHTFTSIGIYNVMLIVTDNGGKINNLTLQIEVIKKTSSGGGGGGIYNPYFPPIEENEKPVASHNGPFFEFEENLIFFNGSKSSDLDGYITNWTWDFGDNNTSYEMNAFHSYSHAGNYSVFLTVTDDCNETDTVLSYAVISVKPNIPPNQPIINGSTIGEIGIEYQYLLQATDPDNDNIKYIVNWDDGSTHISKYFSSGNMYNISHIWDKAGIYHVEIFVEDKKNMASDNIDILVLIDVLYCFDLGYFIDIDNDNIYDQFYLNETENIIELEFKNGIYVIDINGDGNYEYRYEIEDRIIYEMSKEVENQEISSFFFIFPLILVVSIVIYILIKNDKIKIFNNLIKQKSKKHR